VLRFLTAGESHGPALVVTVEGMPAGLPILVDDIASELARRRLGYGRGPRMRFEQDELELLGGVRHGRTLGSPIAIVIRNSEWATGKWSEEMSSAPGETKQPLTQPRPGHADLAGMQKYGFTDARDVLERASARETAARVAAGALAKALLRHLGVSVLSHVVQLGAAVASPDRRPGPDDLESIDSSEVRCCDPDAEAEMIREIKEAAKAGDSLGGVVEVLGFGIPPGLGSHVHWDRRIDGLLAQSLMSIQAMKAVEIGDGAAIAGARGSVAHDAISWDADAGEYRRESSRAGGIEGGMTTGDLLVARVSMKPLATLNRPVLKTVDTETKEESVSFKERTDVTAVPAAGVVAETMVSLVLASEALRKFGGDSLAEFVRNHDAFRASLR
jgi:chorismate synthase